MRVLVIEDDELIGSAMAAGLREGGDAVDWARDGIEAELALRTGAYDIALLDLGLPRMNGLELLRRMRRNGSETPVLIITARDSVDARIEGLDSGADDYLVKPFKLGEMHARIRAIMRRRAGRVSPEIRFGPLILDPVKREVTFRGEPVALSTREFAVLEALMREPGAVVSLERLEEAVYGWGEEVASNTVEVHLHHLRRKLTPEVIRNVRGVGYRVAEDE